MTQQTLLSVNNIAVSYGSLQVLWDISIDVKQGEAVAIIGANGSGKSTLLNTIAGVNNPDSGDIIFNDTTISGMQPFKIVTLGMSLVPEGRRIFPDMTVLENLRLGSYNENARSFREKKLRNRFQTLPASQGQNTSIGKNVKWR